MMLKKVARGRLLFSLVIYNCQLVGLVDLLANLAELYADNSNVSCCILSWDGFLFLFSILSKGERKKEGKNARVQV